MERSVILACITLVTFFHTCGNLKFKLITYKSPF